jgi:AmmeMemoRadiSam system protein A
MQPSLSIELSAEQQRQLLDIARRSIAEGNATNAPLQLQVDALQAELREPAAVFVTLTRNGELRGCVGSLRARDALAQAVANSAFNSAFLDRRFPPLGADELDAIRIEISVLSPMQDIPAESRDDLLRSLQPGIDGLVIEDKDRRATFLPKVWESLGSAELFVGQLMLKAGLSAGHWSRNTRVQRYRTLTFADN